MTLNQRVPSQALQQSFLFRIRTTYNQTIEAYTH
jgi:hypothetical protein